MDFAPVIAAVVTTLGTVGGVYLTARRYGKLGIAPAQMQLQATVKQTMDAQSIELGSLRRQLDDAQKDILEEAAERKHLEDDFRSCKDRLVRLERLVADKALGDATHRQSNDDAERRYKNDR